MGQRPHAGRVRVVAAVVLAVTGGALAGCSSAPAVVVTTLRNAAATTIVHADGSSTAGADGARLAAGDVVRTSESGHVELVTGDRVVYVEPDAIVAVADPSHEQLRHGSVVVDALSGPDLILDVAGLSVTAPTGSAVRADRAVTIRVGSLAGRVDVTSQTGRHLAIDALHQALVGGGDALPDATAPLQLTDDRAEAATVPDLVRDDETLNSLARGIDATGASAEHVVPASFPAALAPAPRRADRSEEVLPAAIAAAGSTDGEQARYDRIVDYRKAGGSWGVIAHLVDVRASAVVDALAAFEKGGPAGQVGSPKQILAAAQGSKTSAGQDGGSTSTDQPTTTPGPGSGGGGGDHNGSGGGPSPSTSPTPSPSPSGGGGGGVIGGLLGVVPTSTPTTPVPLLSVGLG